MTPNKDSRKHSMLFVSAHVKAISSAQLILRIAVMGDVDSRCHIRGFRLRLLGSCCTITGAVVLLAMIRRLESARNTT